MVNSIPIASYARQRIGSSTLVRRHVPGERTEDPSPSPLALSHTGQGGGMVGTLTILPGPLPHGARKVGRLTSTHAMVARVRNVPNEKAGFVIRLSVAHLTPFTPPKHHAATAASVSSTARTR
jgi:hypothetical protein